MAEFFLDLQVWGTPTQCLDRIKVIHEKTDCCGFTGIFRYAGMPMDVATGNLELFAREVLPELRQLGHSPVFDLEDDDEPAFMASAG